MTLGKLPKLQHGGHTIPRSRRPQDRYIVRKGGLTGRWLVEDTQTGEIVADCPAGVEGRELADGIASELNA